MNIGIYLDSLGRIQELENIDTFINTSLEKKLINDASIFYDDVAPVRKTIKCGKFNSTDLWNFSGTLIIPYISSMFKIHGIVNNIKIIYYYGFEEKTPVFPTIQAVNMSDGIVCNSKESSDYLYRITGKRVDNIVSDFSHILEYTK
jgi:hypothetical protein